MTDSIGSKPSIDPRVFEIGHAASLALEKSIRAQIADAMERMRDVAPGDAHSVIVCTLGVMETAGMAALAGVFVVAAETNARDSAKSIDAEKLVKLAVDNARKAAADHMARHERN